MSKTKAGSEIMLATLGVEPQVITITLDALLMSKRPIREVAVIYTDHPGIKDALCTLKQEFEAEAYPHISFRPVPVTNSQGNVKDFQTEEDLHSLLRTLYTEIRQARRMERPIHLCISGGRKVMGVMAMAVAQLLFGPDDRVWYLITEGWKPGTGRHLHIIDSEQVRLVPVPVLRWHEASTLMHAVIELDDPQEMLAWYYRLTNKAEERRQGEFIKHWLTPAERQVMRLACRGFDNSSIAARLDKREQTVANQLRNIYEKLREWLDFPNYNVDRNVLISRFAPYFSLTESKGDH